MLGDVPKWLKGPDSKSGRRRKACGGSNPSISAKKNQDILMNVLVLFFMAFFESEMTVLAVLIYCAILLSALPTTILVRANRAMTLGMTMRLLNISVSSHTRSLLIMVPIRMNTRAMRV